MRGALMLDLLHRLRNISASEAGCTRIAYTNFENDACDVVWDFLKRHDHLRRVEDAAGNMFVVPVGSLLGDAKPILLVGSHVDTVIEGGWLDGTLGVAAGVHALQEFAADPSARERVGLVVFRDEEGVRFNTGLFGSRVFAGLCTDTDLDVRDADGCCLRDLVPDPAGCLQYVPPVRPAGFLECHIEQGIRLEQMEKRIGLVTEIVGIRRYHLEAVGAANHAGTTDMKRRRDALLPLTRIVANLPDTVTDWPDAVITCGRVSVHPGAPNVVPGRAAGVVECRARTDDILDAIEDRLRDAVNDEAERSRNRAVSLRLSSISTVAPLPTDGGLLSHLNNVLHARRIEGVMLPSMAGHDTQYAAHVCPSAMFFIPSIDGISHHPDENSTENDIVLAGEIMKEWVAAVLTR